MRDALAIRGWPEPVYADSGNGAHLLYRLPLMELAQAGDLVKRCLKALATQFSDDAVKVDESTSNASRICKLYGTQIRKGDPLPARPHRRARILDDPERLLAVPREALDALADEFTQKTTTAGTASNPGVTGFDIDRWIEMVGLEVVKGPDAYNGGRRWVLTRASLWVRAGLLRFRKTVDNAQGDAWTRADSRRPTGRPEI